MAIKDWGPPHQARIERARVFAIGAHRAIGQTRKYTGVPYDRHVEAVATTVSNLGTATPDMVAAAWLHDTVEDTAVSMGDITELFGVEVAVLVFALTNVDKSRGNRAARKELDRLRLAAASPSAQTIKLADIIDNTSDIAEHDPKFARVYLEEIDELIKVLDHGNPLLRQRAIDGLNDATSLIRVTSH